MPRLKRSDPASPGIRRRGRGRGFEYVDADGDRVEDVEVLGRIARLAIPPAWRDVWICPAPTGHIQATGIDAAGRKQYRYHEQWRERRDTEKFRTMTDFARSLPGLRRHVEADLGREGMPREKVLAAAVRLLDTGFFRIGSEEYAADNDSFGLATIRKEHVRVAAGSVVFDYPAKWGRRRVQTIADPDVVEVVRAMKRRRSGGDELLAFRTDRGRWCDVRSDDVNAYIKDITGDGYTAKDFRTWNATLLAAVALAEGAERPASETARRRAERAAVEKAAFFLGNTPAVCRASYIDPRVFDRYRDGLTVHSELAGIVEPGGETPSEVVLDGRVDQAVLDLLAGHEGSPGIEGLAAAA